MAQGSERIAFLFDVDNTLLDNDAIQADLAAHLQRRVRQAQRASVTGLCSSSCAANSATPITSGPCSAIVSRTSDDPGLLADLVFSPGLPLRQAAVSGGTGRRCVHCRSLGLTVILSDGDVVFQPRKVQRFRAVGTRSRAASSSTCTRSKCWTGVERPLSGGALRDDRRQAAHPQRPSSWPVGRTGHHGLCAPGPLRIGCARSRALPGCGPRASRTSGNSRA